MTDVRLPSDRYPPGLLAIPCTEVLWSRCAAGLFAMLLRAPSESQVCLDSCQAPIVQKWNYLVEQFLHTQHLRWLLFTDADMLPPADTVQRLLDAGAPADRDMVGALCFTRHRMPYRPAAGYFNGSEVRYLETFDGGVHQVDWLGTGCVLIRRGVLEEAARRRGLEVFRPEPGYVKFDRGEDQEFSRFVGTLGFKLYCDTSISVGHLGLTNIDETLVGRLRHPQAPRDEPDCQAWLRGAPPNMRLDLSGAREAERS